VTFTAAGLADPLSLPADSTAASGNTLQEALAIAVSVGAASSESAVPASASAGPVRLQRAIQLTSGQSVQIAAGSASISDARSSNPSVAGASLDSGVLTVTANAATGMAQVAVSGRFAGAFLSFGLPSPSAPSAGVPFQETLTVRIAAAGNTAGSAAGSTAGAGAGRGPSRGASGGPPDPGGSNTAGGRSSGTGGSGGSGGGKKANNQADGANDAGASPVNEKRNLSVAVGQKSQVSMHSQIRISRVESTSPGIAGVQSKDDQVTVCGAKPGTADINVSGTGLQLNGGPNALGQDYPFHLTVHVQVTGADTGVSGKWTSNKPEGLAPQNNGDSVTITQTGTQVTLMDGHQIQWDGTVSGNRLQFSHTYAQKDVGHMDSNWPPEVQPKLLNITRRLQATLKVADDCSLSLSGQLDELKVDWGWKREVGKPIEYYLKKPAQLVTQTITLWRVAAPPAH
jgi:hypothetical protein